MFSYSYDQTYTLVTLCTLIFFLMVLYVLLKKTDKVIELLKLDKGFDDDKLDSGNFSAESIIKLALVIIALYFILVSVPDILANLFYLFKSSFPQNTLEATLDLYTPTTVDYYQLTSETLRLLMGIIILMNKNKIAAKMERLN
jgi:trehalose/maltose hydrolase-like predicted phosphorylase